MLFSILPQGNLANRMIQHIVALVVADVDDARRVNRWRPELAIIDRRDG